MNENIQMLAAEAVGRMIEKNYRVAAAESCTGGLVAAALVGVPDASRVLDVSIVTYANEAKIAYAGVSEEALRLHGAVSREVAEEMAAGIARTAGAQIGLATTGIAGPGGGTPEKPVGLVWFGISMDGRVESFSRLFAGMERNEVRRAAVEAILRRLLELLKEL
ncbi:MAG: CinA family protein [Lachnospiraceae bacterium]|nr:CinA family protein [Lachnospiraceae bacterium]